MMQRLKLFILSILLPAAVLAAGRTPSSTVSDTFQDGVRNKSLWFKPNWSEHQYMEQDGVLRLQSHPTNSVEGGVVGGLMTRFIKLYNQGDRLSLTCRVRVPHKAENGAVPKQSYELGLGVYASATNNELVELTYQDGPSNRHFSVYCMSESRGYQDSWLFPAPTNRAVVHLRLGYSRKTDMVSFHWAPSAAGPWTKIAPNMKLGDLVDRDRPLLLQPYVTSYTENLRILPAWNVWLDDFRADYYDLPL